MKRLRRLRIEEVQEVKEVEKVEKVVDFLWNIVKSLEIQRISSVRSEEHQSVSSTRSLSQFSRICQSAQQHQSVQQSQSVRLRLRPSCKLGQLVLFRDNLYVDLNNIHLVMSSSNLWTLWNLGNKTYHGFILTL